MKRNITFCIIGLAVGLFGGFQAANATYRSEIAANRNAATVAAAGSVATQAQANQIIDRARQNPQDFEAQHAAAEQFLQIQRPDSALEFLTRAQQLKPDDPETLGELGEVHYLMQRYDEAIRWARRALEVSPDYPLATFYLMASYVETKQNLDEAEKLLAKLESLRPGDRTLAEVRQVLLKSRAESSGTPKAKTTLQHGPEEPTAGGRR